MNKLYPIFLKLKNKTVIIVGGGLIAYQKLLSLIETEAKLIIIAPCIIDEIYALEGVFPNKRNIKFIERDYQIGDEKNAFLVIAATQVSELNNSIANRCQDQGILVNSVDQADYSDFYVPSIIHQNDLKIAISTNGKAPSVSQKIRLDLTSIVEKRYQGLIPLISEFREKVQAKILGQENFARRSRLIRWFTERQFRKLHES